MNFLSTEDPKRVWHVFNVAGETCHDAALAFCHIMESVLSHKNVKTAHYWQCDGKADTNGTGFSMEGAILLELI